MFSLDQVCYAVFGAVVLAVCGAGSLHCCHSPRGHRASQIIGHCGTLTRPPDSQPGRCSRGNIRKGERFILPVGAIEKIGVVNPDPVGSGIFSWIWIRNFLLWIIGKKRYIKQKI